MRIETYRQELLPWEAENYYGFNLQTSQSFAAKEQTLV